MSPRIAALELGAPPAEEQDVLLTALVQPLEQQAREETLRAQRLESERLEAQRLEAQRVSTELQTLQLQMLREQLAVQVRQATAHAAQLAELAAREELRQRTAESLRREEGQTEHRYHARLTDGRGEHMTLGRSMFEPNVFGGSCF